MKQFCAFVSNSFVLGIILFSPQAVAIWIRHDVDENQYLDLAASFPAVGSIGSCTATLVSPTLILTAAHCFFSSFEDTVVDVDPAAVTFFLGNDQNSPTQTRGVTNISVNPDFLKLPPGNRFPTVDHRSDMALLTLDAPIVDVQPSEVDPALNQLGQVATLVGFGDSGTGLDFFATQPAGTKRAARNVIDPGDPVFFDEFWYLDFDSPPGTPVLDPNDPPENVLGLPEPLALEGGVGAGDSGGPLIVGGRVVGVVRGANAGNNYGSTAIYAQVGFASNLSFLLSGGLSIPSRVAIDIKPGNKRNIINPRANGGIWVAVLSDTETPFDPLQIDISTMRFGPDDARVIRYKVEDVNEDGLADLLLRFGIRRSGIECGDTAATVTGRTFDEKSVFGTDSIETVGCKKGHHDTN